MTVHEILVAVAIGRWQQLKKSPREIIGQLAGEVLLLRRQEERLRQQIEGHCDRIAAQSELLSRRAEQ